MCPLEHARQALEVVLNDKIGVTKLDAATALVLHIGNLVVRLPFDGVESQVLGQIEQEASVIAAEVEAS